MPSLQEAGKARPKGRLLTLPEPATPLRSMRASCAACGSPVPTCLPPRCAGGRYISARATPGAAGHCEIIPFRDSSRDLRSLYPVKGEVGNSGQPVGNRQPVSRWRQGDRRREPFGCLGDRTVLDASLINSSRSLRVVLSYSWWWDYTRSSQPDHCGGAKLPPDTTLFPGGSEVINADKPYLWKADVERSVDTYNAWFLEFAPQAFRESRRRTRPSTRLSLNCSMR